MSNASYEPGGPEEAPTFTTTQTKAAPPPRKLPTKSPTLTGLLSVMPGLGQVYVGYYRQGFLNLAVVAGTITLLAAGEVPGLEPLFGVFLAFFWLFNIVDATRKASFYNRAVQGLGTPELPADFDLPGTGGEVLTGIVLIGLGTLLLMHTKFDMSMEWLADWWPEPDLPVISCLY